MTKETRCDPERALTVVPDANVLIHGRSLQELPWNELERSIIEILFVPPVIREIYTLKNQTGKPNKIARQISSDIRTLIKEYKYSKEINRSAPNVTKRVELKKVTEPLHDSLNLGHADQSLINYCLHLRKDGLDVLLITDDTICLTTAREFGLPAMFLDDHWRRDPESDEASKEVTRLKDQLRQLSRSEPDISFSFEDAAGQKIEEFEVVDDHWPPLSGSEIDELMERVKRSCPAATSFERNEVRDAGTLNGLGPVFEALARRSRPFEVYEPASEEEIRRYKTVDYPNWSRKIETALRELHENLESHKKRKTIYAIASNIGTRPALDVLLCICAQGEFKLCYADNDAIWSSGTLISGDSNRENFDSDMRDLEVLSLPLPPKPPRGRVKKLGFLGTLEEIANQLRPAQVQLPTGGLDLTTPSPRHADRFYWRSGRRGWTNLMELDCQSWRHKSEYLSFSLQIRANCLGHVGGAIEVKVQASNISNPKTAKIPIRIVSRNVSTVREAETLIEDLEQAARNER